MKSAVHFKQQPSDPAILAFVESWIDDLIRGDFKTAFLRTEQDPYYCWSPELIRAVIQGYGLPEPRRDGKVFVATPRSSAVGGPPQRIVERDDLQPPVIAEVWHDLPLNGKWSDLTATFRIESRGDGAVAVLQEIHVF